MTAAPLKRMTVDEFLAWADEQPRGRFELLDGIPLAKSPERVRHLEGKLAAVTGLSQSIKRAGLRCRALPDGATVRIDERTAYEPDALVYCGKSLDGDDVEIPNPVIVVEVTSPSSKQIDAGAKVAGYFAVPSVHHYLIIDAKGRRIIHHKRGAGEMIETRILSEGPIRLDPPGLETSVAEMLGPV